MEILTAQPRKILGKSVKNLRKEGLLPAVAYGKGLVSEHIAVPYKEFLRVWKSVGESALMLLKLPEGEKNALIHDVALDSIKNTPVHADFYMVDMKSEVEVDVPFEFKGEAEAGKASGGILVKVMHELKVKSLPGSLPHSLVIDVSRLQNPKDAIFVKDLVLSDGVVSVDEASETIAIIEEPKAVVEEAPTVSADEALKEIKVVKPEKKAETAAEEKTSS